MDELLKNLKLAGIHHIINDNEIILEILEEKVNNTSEIDTAINELITHSDSSKQKKIIFQCPKTLLNHLTYTKEKMKMVGERVIFAKVFTQSLNNSLPIFEMWPLENLNSISFLSEVMDASFTEAQRFLSNMKTELPSQAEKMYTVLLHQNQPAGVVFPHLEPDTDHEGRIFWIGMHPNFLRKGLGQSLHLIGLHRLQSEFNAKSYLGATSVNNIAMRKIMLANGCVQNQSNVVSLEYCI